MKYVTLPDVDIAYVGMNWPASTGTVSLTLDHLADAQKAAMEDPHILIPRLKVGHTDPRFNEDPPIHDPFTYHGPLKEDGNPIFGRVANLRLVNDGALLRGDYIDMPEWLAEAAPSAYPTRSLEGDWDIVTPGGKRYSFVLTAVALGGVWMPAIGALDDLPPLEHLELLLTEGPEAVNARIPVTASRREPMPVNTAASVDAVISTFFDDFAQGDRYWWWPVDVWVDPNQVVADDEEGHLFRVPFSTDADGNVEFAEPVRVMQEFRDLPAVAASMKGELAARFTAASYVRPKDRVRAANQPEGGKMTDEHRKQLAVKNGLAEDATEEQITAKLLENALAEPTAADDPPAVEDPKPDEDEPVVEDNVIQLPVAAKLDPDAFAQMQEDAKLGREAREEQVSARRAGKVAEAIQAGKIPPARQEHYLALMKSDEDGTTAFLAALTDGAIPVDERGKAPSEDGAESATHETIMASFGVVRKEA